VSEESAKSLCFECKRPLVEIDNRGQRLHDVQHLVVAHGWRAVKLSVKDLAALHAIRRSAK
jgi:hypothetical protein